ncbi:hypothetical protein LTR12_016832 [Friedmanniomyces endolithicus]|nr:hypothetical protein LTR87_016805 [Friedmanniomyces endolithicus]KAK1808809.1 hypothetical protein LTR12_016832 [Friedmanniomyces endolithicus]
MAKRYVDRILAAEARHCTPGYRFARGFRDIRRALQPYPPLDSDDQEAGYVYAYEVEGSPGLVKIGYTSRSIDVRHKEWAEDCNRKPTLLYPVKLDKLERVPNARRIESLCHAELDKYRLRIYCQGCLKQHIEWFAVAAEKAVGAIRKWTSWMETEPYGRDFKGRMVLSSKWQQALVDEQRFLTQVSTFEGPSTTIAGKT